MFASYLTFVKDTKVMKNFNILKFEGDWESHEQKVVSADNENKIFGKKKSKLDKTNSLISVP